MHPERKLQRHPYFHYSQNGMYFVTICTKNRIPFFGNITNKHMCLNAIGNIAQQCWQDIPKHFPNVSLDAFVIMPDHIHGIICISENNDMPFPSWKDFIDYQNNNYDRSKMMLSKIVHGFKSSVTRFLREEKNNYEFGWQKSFHDHIIRDEGELNNIRNYIVKNPENWKQNK